MEVHEGHRTGAHPRLTNEGDEICAVRQRFCLPVAVTALELNKGKCSLAQRIHSKIIESRRTVSAEPH